MNTYILRVVAFASTRLGRVVVAGVCLIAILAVASTLLGPDINTEIKLNNYKKTDKLCLLRVFDTYVITNSVNGSKGIFIAPCDAILALKFSEAMSELTEKTARSNHGTFQVGRAVRILFDKRLWSRLKEE